MRKTESDSWLLHPEEIKKHDRGGGASTTPLVTKSMGASAFITGYTEFAGGAKIPFHFHNCEESVLLIEGNAIFDIDGNEFPIKPQDVTFIPAGVAHRFRNASETEPMKIMWIYGSPDANRTLVETGETRPIAAEHKN
ncbi:MULTISPECIES: cupin domain-containing protein [unclassified Pantoea]|jgi:quercetin dioxygenase-like cupin family protein|uniref:cupin domain-containing protein n=1 Tax=unclassified Pantoea TaxID=2630326 RepID=UPI0023DA3374|nr:MULTISPECIES: cupin domain-containing protein [unclassified Pantoea]MDF2041154.1 cupin domain-containing protein [Pantoea sp. Cr_R14]MDF2071459.1 cupin domain-containing protein [Pantoea sp. Cr_R13]MDF2078192.1 cupin domain-containing protein [Pantoea sp. Cr_R21]MDF2914390.1 cupin [Pantoea agglomerans]